MSKQQTVRSCPIGSHGNDCGICTGCGARMRVDEDRPRFCISCTSWFCPKCVPTFETVYDPYTIDSPMDWSNTVSVSDPSCGYCGTYLKGINNNKREERTHLPVCAICRQCFRNFATTLDLSDGSLTRAVNSVIVEYFGAETLFVISKTDNVSAERSGIQAKDVIGGPEVSNTWDVCRFGLLWVDFIQSISSRGIYSGMSEKVEEQILNPAGDVILKAQVIKEYRDKFKPAAAAVAQEAKQIVPWIALLYWEEEFEETDPYNWKNPVRTELHHMCVTTLAQDERSAKHKMLEKLIKTLNDNGSARYRNVLGALDKIELQCIVDDALPVAWLSV